MCRFAVLFVIFAVVSAKAPTLSFHDAVHNNRIDFSGEDETSWTSVQMKNSSPELSKEVTNGFTVAQVTAVPTDGDFTLQYVLGKRVRNDRPIFHDADDGQWPSTRDITFTVKYPSSGLGANVTAEADNVTAQGAILTYAIIFVRQSTMVGEVKVISGGIGQSSIAVFVKAHTSWIGYNATFYGI